MRRIAADLHVHSALSACADDAMTPPAMVYAAIAAELDVIAVCDHNSAGNAAALQEAAHDLAGDLFHVIAGMEITTREEVHLVGLFPDAGRAMSASDELALSLPDIPLRAGAPGRQWLLDAEGNTVGEVSRLLSLAADLDLAEAAALIRRHDGLVIAAHVDRPSYSVISQLGLMPDQPRFDAIEISAAGVHQGRQAEFEDCGYAMLSTSDAHFLDNIGDGRTLLYVDEPSFEEITRALNSALDGGCRLA